MMNGGLSLSESKPRLGLIGNPENRRIVDFQAAAAEEGYAKPICLSYERLLADLSELERFVSARFSRASSAAGFPA